MLHEGQKPNLAAVVSAYGNPTEVLIRSCPEGLCEVELVLADHGLILISLVPAVADATVEANVTADAMIGQVYMVESASDWIATVCEFEGPPMKWKGYSTYPEPRL